MRPPQPERVPAPELPEDIAFSDLDRAVRARLRTLSKENAENVGLHLVMTGRLLDSDPELAYEHAQAAVRCAGRVDVVREAAGLAAYRTGRFAEALRELRTVRRLNGSSEHLAVMADCERGLGRPERALTLAASPEAEGLGSTEAVELAIVVSGARLDLGEPEAAIAVLSAPAVRAATGTLAVRVAQALAAAYEAAGRADDAREVLAGFTAAQLEEASGIVEEEDEVVVFDLDDDADDATHEHAAVDEAAADEAARDDRNGDVDGDEAVDDLDGDEAVGAAGRADGEGGADQVAGRGDRGAGVDRIDGRGEDGADHAEGHGHGEGGADQAEGDGDGEGGADQAEGDGDGEGGADEAADDRAASAPDEGLSASHDGDDA